uniref:NADH-ubiquinone oxidoreductase chain 4L n=1 Tax=Brachycentrus kozlovi TaxID=2566358 RepID=A0A9E8LPI3_9NEOP|nr:NADH dehydrogenase subunit 4L [Brachycentrus kozlovi]UZZ43814.1 NADH dehydrogenase subunit 4L [Brachycentrus kozlovi]
MKIMFMKYVLFLNYMVGNFLFSLNRKHLLVILLSLELIMLIMFMFIYSYMLIMGSFYFMILFLILTVCEGVLGLSILIFMIRMCGNDYIQVFSLI